ncbi:outer membrane lipid asymmetry maintenance protein MlaD [bacterium endosymbiont of Pedicinus badii]|uniref:outer membrane lipid asymmetry maintenance protein MlaD n=1 Tax=bacterium endosymbiont of Pedicinus badii TaxID=1719126 RepID=UPI0009BA4CF5|nr:outer membrane lipid asymmetry maintenance protein MlaD [bacterium endosymbiont of Pedicinus badii]OQM34146.1 hypothetical protein AOQ89_02280 [bacterium endosymbiont of Pedicinus badii]
MQIKKYAIFSVVFIVLFVFSLLFIVSKVTNIQEKTNRKTYKLFAFFDDISGLKLKSPVKIGGVLIGRISQIELSSNSYLPKVTIEIQKTYNKIPVGSVLVIRTSGLLGEQYLSFNIASDTISENYFLKDGDIVENTKSAIVIEELISQFFYNIRNSSN